jgi:hypothetical protein
MDFILSHWDTIVIIILIIDKIVTATPPGKIIFRGYDIGKNDDMIWSTVKGMFLRIFNKKQPKITD